LIYGKQVTQDKNKVYLFRRERLKEIRKGYDADFEEEEDVSTKTSRNSSRKVHVILGDVETRKDEDRATMGLHSSLSQASQETYKGKYRGLNEQSAVGGLDLTVRSEQKPSSILPKPSKQPRKIKKEVEAEDVGVPEPWENEAEELVNWTSQLNVNEVG
jgi:hypothetical protein